MGYLRSIVDPVAGSFEEFSRKHYPAVLAYLQWRTRDPDLAKDLTQETFLQAFRNRETFDPALGNEHGWLLGIARNVSAYAARRKSHMPQAEAIAEEAWVEEKPEENERLSAMRQCMQALTERVRDVLKLVYEEKLGYAQVAKKLGMGLSAVKVAAFRARQALLECIRRRLSATKGPA